MNVRDIVTSLVVLYVLVGFMLYFHALNRLAEQIPTSMLDFYSLFILLLSCMLWFTLGIKIWQMYLERVVFFCRLWWYEKVTMPARRREWERRYKTSWKNAARAIVKEEP